MNSEYIKFLYSDILALIYFLCKDFSNVLCYYFYEVRKSGMVRKNERWNKLY